MFDKVLGNQSVKEIFQRMISADRVSGAMLFVGENGVGKKLFALEVAKTFLCHNLKNNESCDECPACHRAMNFNLPKSLEKDDNEKVFFSEHSDLGLIRPAGKFITVSQIRELEREANFRPFEGKARIFIIDQAERMNDSSSNALLKTLEEPPTTSFIFLLTSRPMSLLPTIRSRCQVIRFAPLTAHEIENHLLSTQKFSEADARLLARLARGSIGRALEIDLNLFKQQRDSMFGVLESLFSPKNRARLLKTAEELNDPKNKEFYEPSLEVLQTLMNDVWALRLGKDVNNLVNYDLKLKLEKFVRQPESLKISNWIDEIETLRENLVVNINRKVATDALFLKMANH